MQCVACKSRLCYLINTSGEPQGGKQKADAKKEEVKTDRTDSPSLQESAITGEKLSSNVLSLELESRIYGQMAVLITYCY